jgi:hypothetical protein
MLKKNIFLSFDSKFSFAFCLLFATFSNFAQDKIVKKGGETLEVKILEIGPNEIKYHIFSDPQGPIFIMDKDRILEVIYENGRKETYQSVLTDAEFYIGQKKRAIKMNFISPLLGYTQVAYEQNSRPGRSFEVSLGIIGLGANLDYYSWDSSNLKLDQRGAFGSFGYKFIRTPDFTSNNQKYGHIMQGMYVKPEVMVGHFSNNVVNNNIVNFNNSSVDRQSTTFGAFMVNLGKQWVFSDVFLIDLYAGVGYAFQGRTNDSNNDDFFNGRLYGVTASDNGASFAISGGFRIGILLK